jgi:hypothetical protein
MTDCTGSDPVCTHRSRSCARPELAGDGGAEAGLVAPSLPAVSTQAAGRPPEGVVSGLGKG